MKVVILAAGRGTRMGEITIRVPKPMLPVAGVPAIERVILAAKRQGFAEFVVVTGYLGEQVRGHLGVGEALGVSLSCVQQEQQTGTASALLITREQVGNSDLLLCFADIMTSPENYSRMRRRFAEERCDVTAALRQVDDPWRAAAVYVDGEMNIERLIEKPAKGTSTTPWAHAGMYCFRPSIFDYLEQVKPSPRAEYEVVDAVSAMIADGKRVRGVELTGYWKDLATPEDIAQAARMVQNG
ncbi:MAG: nucleotidyltransferase family protein [Candidatus Sumerlaeaceae bacterium]